MYHQAEGAARGEMADEASGAQDPSTPGCGESPGMKDRTLHPPSGETDMGMDQAETGAGGGGMV